MLIGVLSDTHGLLRPEALAALRGSALIVHAVDVGSPDILPALRTLAPVHAVRGNVDTAVWARELSETVWVRAGRARLFVLHQLTALDPGAVDHDCAAVIYGHSHRASIEERDGVLYLNPGAAGPRRFNLSPSLAKIEVRGQELDVSLVTL